MATTTRNHRRNGSHFGGSTQASSRRNIFGLAGSTQLKNTFA